MKIKIFFLALLLMLTGCRRAEPAPTRQAPVLPSRPRQTEATQPTRPEIPESHYINKVYSAQLRQYYTALLQQWPDSLYEQAQRSPLGARFRDGDPLENVGFALKDLDGDAFCELVIGAIRDAEEFPVILEIWTAPGLEPLRLFSSQDGDVCCLHHENDRWSLERRVGTGEEPDAVYFYSFSSGQAPMEQGLRRSGTEEAPEWQVLSGKEEPVALSAEEAEAILDECHEGRTMLRYYPFYLYTP